MWPGPVSLTIFTAPRQAASGTGIETCNSEFLNSVAQGLKNNADRRVVVWYRFLSERPGIPACVGLEYGQPGGRTGTGSKLHPLLSLNVRNLLPLVRSAGGNRLSQCSIIYEMSALV